MYVYCFFPDYYIIMRRVCGGFIINICRMTCSISTYLRDRSVVGTGYLMASVITLWLKQVGVNYNIFLSSLTI